MSEVQPGLYEIISCIGPTGVHNPGPTPDEVVRVNQPHLVWRITHHPSGKGYRLSICKFPYTGVTACTPGSDVIATSNEQKEMVWIFVKRAQDKYSIHPMCDPGLAWTVKDPSDKESPIVIDPFQWNACQLYILERVYQDDCPPA